MRGNMMAGGGNNAESQKVIFIASPDRMRCAKDDENEAIFYCNLPSNFKLNAVDGRRAEGGR